MPTDLGEIHPRMAPIDLRPVTLTLLAHPRAEVVVLRIPEPTPVGEHSLKARYLKRVLVPVSLDFMTEMVEIPLVFETEKGAGQTDWTDWTVRIEGTRTAIGLAVVSSIAKDRNLIAAAKRMTEASPTRECLQLSPPGRTYRGAAPRK
jgi:hypothetical protein